jgi:HEAT repeat protein
LDSFLPLPKHVSPWILVFLFNSTFPLSAAESDEPLKLDRLEKQLQSPSIDERLSAIQALQTLPQIPVHFFAVLIPALQDHYYDVRTGAANALSRIGTPAIPALLEALKDPHYYSPILYNPHSVS